MSLSHEHVGSKIPAKINTYMLTRAELLIHLCYEIHCVLTVLGFPFVSMNQALVQSDQKYKNLSIYFCEKAREL